MATTLTNTPPSGAVSAINSGLTIWTRRAEIYESDGTTLWTPPNGSTTSRLIGGNVNVDYTRDERRTLDITLDNTDGMLESDGGEGFWYNKIIKVYRGVTYGTSGWETQLGEFHIDNIGNTVNSDQVRVSARDPWKKLSKSKLPYSESFPPGTFVYQLVRAMAANAGITRIKVPFTNDTLGTTLDVERGTDRGEVIKKAANSANYDVYFDNFGYLTMSKIPDPALDPAVITFQTGSKGNLVTYEKSVNDSRLYNHIIVYGDRESVAGGQVLMPFFGEAKNEDPNSPTSIDEIGDRVYTYASSFFTSDEQCVRLAQSWLNIYSLESYEINFSSLYYPHLDVGKVIQMFEPNKNSATPTRFLLDTIDFPLGLQPMGATGKRVIAVG